MNDWENILLESLRKRWKRYGRTLRRCQKKFTEKSVHKSRVETRRLVSLLELLNVFLGQSRLKKTRRMLKRHLDAFAPLRDAQVQSLLLAGQRHQFPETEGFHRMLVKRQVGCLKVAARSLKRVKTRPVEKVVERLVDQLAHVRPGASQRSRHRTAVMHAVSEAFRRSAELRRAMDPGMARTIHRTRVAFKRFRYMVEALQPLLAGITRKRLDAMHDFQVMLGEVQDTELLLLRLVKFIRKKEDRAKSLAAFRRWLMLRQTAQITHCLKESDRLDEFWPLPTRRRSPTSSSQRDGAERPAKQRGGQRAAVRPRT